VILTLALRSLFAHPIRSAVLAAGFGLGVSVMAILLGVGQVVLEQAQAPELAGGGDVVVTGSAGEVTAARVVLAGPLRTGSLGEQTRAASPWSRTTLYLVEASGTLPVRARGGIPSLERQMNDPEVAEQPAWTDTAADRRWTEPTDDDLLRTVDRFHPIPVVPARAASWAEWLYFNGRAANARFYLTFIAGPRQANSRVVGVRLQLDRGGAMESFGASAQVDDAALARAPDLTIGNNHVRLEGGRYHLDLDLRDARGRRARGTLTLQGSATRLVPPIEMHGAAGWRTGYVVPVMAGALSGTLTVDGKTVSFENGAGYHDHNWGFWEGVSWQWGQVHHGDLSFVYGRVFPPADAADPDRLPGFLAAIGPSGPLGYTTNVTITETNDESGRPREIEIHGRSQSLELALTFVVDDLVITPMQQGAVGTGLEFLQMRGSYQATGRVGEQGVAFRAAGAAETFRAPRASQR